MFRTPLGFGTFCHDCVVSVGLEDSTVPYEEASQIEVGQVGQLQTCEKAYEIRKFANFANLLNFISGISKAETFGRWLVRGQETRAQQ